MLEHMKRQVYKWKFLQLALSRYVFNRSLFDILPGTFFGYVVDWFSEPSEKNIYTSTFPNP